MGKLFTSLFGGSESPKVVTQAPAEVATEKTKTKKIRTMLYETSGGGAGQEATTVSHNGRSTLYGN